MKENMVKKNLNNKVVKIKCKVISIVSKNIGSDISKMHCKKKIKTPTMFVICKTYILYLTVDM